MTASEEADGAKAVPGLHWPIKRSFVTYVARTPDSQVLGGPGVRLLGSDMFVFAPDDTDEPGSLAFRGEVRFQAHGGALSLRIARPRVRLHEDRSELVIDGATSSGPGLRLVTFVAVPLDLPGARASWSGVDVRLAVEALPLFSGYYGEDERFDDLSIVVPDSD